MEINCKDKNKLIMDIYSIASINDLLNGLCITYGPDAYNAGIRMLKIKAPDFTIKIGVQLRNSKFDYPVCIHFRVKVPYVNLNDLTIINEFAKHVLSILISGDYFELVNE